MQNRLNRIFIALILFASFSFAGEEAEPVVFNSGRDGALNIMLLAGPFANPQPGVESAKARGMMPAQNDKVHGSDTKWRLAYSRDKLVDCSQAGGGKRCYYACVEILIPEQADGYLFVNASDRITAWLDSSPAVLSKPVERMHSLSIPLPKKAGTSRLWLRLDAEKPPAAFYFFAGRIADGRLTPTTNLQLKLHLRDFAEKLRGEIFNKAISFGSSPRFIDKTDKLRFRMEIAGEYLPAIKGKVRLTVSGEHDWLTGSSRIKEVPTFFREGISLGLDVPKKKISWLTTNVTGKLWLGEMLLTQMEVPLFCEANLKFKIEELESQAEKEKSGIAKLALEQIGMLTESRVNRTLYYGTLLTSRIELAIKALASDGKDILKGTTGNVEAAYICRTDGSAQPYKYYMPPKAYAMRETRRIPMILMLHGYVPSYNKLSWMDIDSRICTAMDQLGWCYVLPFGRGCTDFLSIGEVDVLRVIEEMSRRYPIDRTRIYLAGYSMGGSGVWTMLSHYPDVFAAAQIWSGRTDYYFWHNEDYRRAGVSRETIPPWKRILIDSDNPYHLVETLRSTPIRAVHPLDDSLIKPGHSIRIFDLLRPPAGMMTLVRPARGSHWYYSEEIGVPNSYQWMTRHAITRPKTVEHITLTPKYGKKHWLWIQGITEWGKPARVKAEVDIATRRFTVHEMENVKSLSFNCNTFGEQLAKETWNISFKDSTAKLTNGAAGLKWWPGLPKRGTKTPAICGPVKEAFNTRFLLVTGEGLENIENMKRFCSDWQTFAHAQAPRTQAANVTGEQIADCNLICFGSPETNSFLGRIADKLPFAFHDDGYGIGGKRAKGAGFVAVYPNPLNPERLVVIIDGLYYGKALSFNHKWDLVPDYIVFDHKTDSYDNTNTANLAGFFDSDWK